MIRGTRGYPGFFNTEVNPGFCGGPEQGVRRESGGWSEQEVAGVCLDGPIRVGCFVMIGPSLSKAPSPGLANAIKVEEIGCKAVVTGSHEGEEGFGILCIQSAPYTIVSSG